MVPLHRLRLARAASVLIGTVLAGQAYAQAPVRERTGLEQRVQRIERMVESSGMVQLLESVKALQKDVRELRGEVEVQAHMIGPLKQRQPDGSVTYKLCCVDGCLFPLDSLIFEGDPE